MKTKIMMFKEGLGASTIFLLLIGLTVFGVQQKVDAQAASWCTMDFYNELVAHFFENVPPAPAYLDLNGDSFIDLTDYSIFVNCYNATPVPADNTSGNNEQPTENPSNSESQPTTEPTLAPLDYGSTTPFGDYSLRISATGGVNIRSGPGVNYDIIGRAVYGGYFEILVGPVDGWYQIRFSGGAGWVSAANVEVSPTYPEYQETTISFDDWSITIEYNPTARQILNGSEIIAWEINRLRERMIAYHIPCETASSACDIAASTEAFFSAVDYNMELLGEVEDIRQAIEGATCGINNSCTNARFVSGTELMDTSGPGNIVFGYICASMGIPVDFENWLSDRAQTVRDIFELRYRGTDYPDDVNQRLVGRRIYELSGENTPGPAEVEIASNDIGGLNQ